MDLNDVSGWSKADLALILLCQYCVKSEEMSILLNPYYYIIKNFINMTGHSHFYSMWLNVLIKSFYWMIIISYMAAQIAGMITAIGDLDLIFRCIPPTCYVLIGAIIFINNNLHKKEMDMIFERMQNDWDILTSKDEADILHKYGKRCRFYSFICFCGFFGNVIFYFLVHTIPHVTNLIKQNNAERQTVFHLEFGIDPEKYYYLILVHSHVSAYSCTVLMVTGDTTFLMCLEHACGIFEIIGHKLATAIKQSTMSDDYSLQQKMHNEIKLCVVMHRKIVLFINDVQNIFSTPYLLIIGLCIIDLSITGVQTVINIHSPKAAIQFGCYSMGQVLHIFILTVPTQHLLDNSLILSTRIYEADWYNLSNKMKKLLLLIMRKGAEPTTFIVGKIFILSLQIFTKINVIKQNILSFNYCFSEKQASEMVLISRKEILENISTDNGIETGVHLRNLRQSVSSVISKRKAKFEKASRKKAIFESENEKWLNGPLYIPNLEIDEPSGTFSSFQIKPGRPKLYFSEMSDRSKRRDAMQVSELCKNDPLRILKAAEAGAKKSKMSELSAIIKKILKSSEYIEIERQLTSVSSVVPKSAEEALTFILDNNLSKAVYTNMRLASISSGADIWPAYNKIKDVKAQCRPPKEEIVINEKEAKVSLQFILRHTAERVVQLQNEVIIEAPIKSNSKMLESVFIFS
ncbi:uncharacterized protein LOC122510643 [Leptopilina heterotoma]|uniref:uncharacterized protein LOC122510643 n=1 Tax=Leptopilina heterotoma TaxID=63436 RepID=UPI001CA9BD36|nr:uncharacterized protein LOC122510643 [Leptopilina heterotoma]